MKPSSCTDESSDEIAAEPADVCFRRAFRRYALEYIDDSSVKVARELTTCFIHERSDVYALEWIDKRSDVYALEFFGGVPTTIDGAPGKCSGKHALECIGERFNEYALA